MYKNSKTLSAQSQHLFRLAKHSFSGATATISAQILRNTDFLKAVSS
jgi:hypothetical protein